MNNNDRLTRLRYAMEFTNTEMVEIFKLGGASVNKKEVIALLERTSEKKEDDDHSENTYELTLTNEMLERFLNGFITYERGKKDGPEPELEMTDKNVNNILLKRVKIALSLKSYDILDIMDLADLQLSESELSAVLRKEGHRNYQPCGDRYIRNFLKGLAISYRD